MDSVELSGKTSAHWLSPGRTAGGTHADSPSLCACPLADGVVPTRTRRHHAFGDHQSCLKPFTEDDFDFNDSEADPGNDSRLCTSSHGPLCDVTEGPLTHLHGHCPHSPPPPLH